MSDATRTGLWLVVVAGLLAAVLVPRLARAEMAPNFPRDQHDWLHRQYSPAGVKCCDPGDCWVVAARVRQVDPNGPLSGYQAEYDAQWIDIPRTAVTRVPNPVGQPILCISPARHVWCFILGPET